METLFIFVTLLTAATATHIPDTGYKPTLEQLEMILGPNAPVYDKTSNVETPALVPKESVNCEKNIRPYQKKNEVYNNVKPESVEVNIKIKVNDCDNKGTDKNVKQNPEKDSPGIHSRFEDLSLTDDRVALGADECVTGKVRVGNTCVTPDPQK